MEIQDMNLEENQNLEVVLEPKVGTIFNSEYEAHECYARYAKAKGFGSVTKTSKKRDGGLKSNITYGCHRSGKPRTTALNPGKSHPTTKIDCKAQMNISLQVDGKWMLNSIELKHNHEMDLDKVKYLKCYRTNRSHAMRKLNGAAEIKLNKTIASCVIEARAPENLTWLEKDARNYEDKVGRLWLKEGDADALHKYFVKMQKDNGDFFYAIDLDEDNRLRNVFWADARSRELYKEFGDVVTFDTTYLVNNYDMPFASFVGVNHHGQSILFGCGLISWEDTASFVWLFESWLSCMFDCYPNAIITDLCRAMQNAISQVFPNARHRWCLWHIMKKISEKLKGYDEYKQIKRKLKNVVYDSLNLEEFEQNWADLINAYDLQGNDWLAGLYEERHRWVPAFVKDTFWAGMSTTQRGESMNAFFDGYVHSNTTLKEFVEQYENALRKKVQEEEEADARSLNVQVQNVSPYGFENQFQQAYTVAKYKQFRVQVAEKIGCNLTIGLVVNGISQFHIEQDILVGKRKDTFKTVTFLVHFNEESRETNCNCRLFESKGMVCTHMISVWSKKKLEVVPDKYILRRWRKNLARSHTKVKVSYVNWERKPEFGRYDSLLELFNKAADKAMYSTAKTDRMAARLREIKAENDLYDEECLSNMPMVGELLSNVDVFPQFFWEQTPGEYEATVGDPSKGPRRGRLPAKRKQ
ncbi:protein FAR-RED IMPAIRED RESPONSE 1-like [Rhododendron vialii]|uniref:protein FAR-RED IMPAIRED RESPONSE 1-like n=1 Tax=Rhododendron vialii TaxID=182163 RepID=UPI00265EE76B|nr:protein FAR-RED IMPAIRED RESPONSE 1-like [Rhododendron vialii]XP_058222511.1 protein FAR-RED IMPAIRED RESPONSE 1-like [Rhododendron vialii]XP_058222512.1 protein FAR-RED IMPAIRED RESPONSE 1-like [Rhododendron vialii]XP_058222513.1 protein FAR-RED IMPAIRED RESPONSE 1-like [Rhododendron vialii]